MNEELIRSAVSFLQDSDVVGSPINKKIEFLQSKGLDEREIEEALKRASQAPASNISAPASAPMTYREAVNPAGVNMAPYDYYGMAPTVPERTWKDYFIMATATAGVTYGLYQVVSRYLLPSIVPPGQSRVDEDKKAIDEEFLKIDKVLEQMAQEQKEVKDANEAKLKDIDVVIANVNDFLAKYNKDKLKFDDDLRLMKLEVDNLQNLIEKNMKLTKDNIRDELQDISEELASLKSLIKARGGSASGPERKVVPVSSIPLALEILKKAKEKQEPVPHSNGHLEPAPESRKGEVEVGGVKAAGIPDWQLAHKKQEEEQERAKEKPLWQTDEVVSKNIQSVGVPQWQLNAASKE